MGSFSDQISAFVRKSRASCSAIHANATVELERAIIKDSPLKTGRTKANWQATVNAPAITALYEKTGIDFYTSNYNWQKTVKESEDRMKMLGIDGVTYINNLVNYVVELEYNAPGEGGSYQAPNGMARINVARWKEIVGIALQKTQFELR
jgi:hypothetical protein